MRFIAIPLGFVCVAASALEPQSLESKVHDIAACVTRMNARFVARIVSSNQPVKIDMMAINLECGVDQLKLHAFRSTDALLARRILNMASTDPLYTTISWIMVASGTKWTELSAALTSARAEFFIKLLDAVTIRSEDGDLQAYLSDEIQRLTTSVRQIPGGSVLAPELDRWISDPFSIYPTDAERAPRTIDDLSICVDGQVDSLRRVIEEVVKTSELKPRILTISGRCREEILDNVKATIRAGEGIEIVRQSVSRVYSLPLAIGSAMVSARSKFRKTNRTVQDVIEQTQGIRQMEGAAVPC